MEKDLNPCRFRNLDVGTNNLRSPGLGWQQNTNPMVFPAYADPFGFCQLDSALIPPSPLNPTNCLSGFAAAEKRFLVFNQSGDQTSLIFSSAGTQFPTANPTSRGLNLPASNEIYVPNGNGSGSGEELHEDTEEIDALLYSDADDDKEEASTGHSPFETTMATGRGSTEEEEVASSSVPAAGTKRRRVFDEELDEPSIIDTASSAGSQHAGGHDNGESSWVGRSKRLKRERIRETIGVLRRIIPGGKGKDAAAVLDEAIRYLRSLKLKAKGLGSTNL